MKVITCQSHLHSYTRNLSKSPYSTKWIKKKPIDHYGDFIVICSMKGCIIYFQKNVNKLLHADNEKERERASSNERQANGL